MAAKPVTIPTWATGTNYSTGSYAGLPTKVAPSGRADGHIPDTPPLAEHENYDRNLIGEWITYLDDLHGSADFLGQDYIWTGEHEFTDPVEFSGSVTCTGLTGLTVDNTIFCDKVVTLNAGPALDVYNGATGGAIRIHDALGGGYYSGTLAFSPSQLSGEGSYDAVTARFVVTNAGSGAALCLNGLLPKNAYIQRVYVLVIKGGTQPTSIEVLRRNPTTGATDPALDSANSSLAGAQLFDTGVIASADRQMIDQSTYVWEIRYNPASTDVDNIAAIHVDYRLPEIGKPS